MAVQTIHISMEEGPAFKSQLPSGASVLMDGKGPKPLEMMFATLGNCAGLTLLSVAGKMGLNIDRLEIDVEGTLADDKVQAMRGAHLVYRLWGANLEQQKVERLLELTEKYCPVYNTLRCAGPIGHSYEMNP